MGASIPVEPRWGKAADAPATFSCCQCAGCCRDLKERRGAPQWPPDYRRLARQGYYPLPTEAGLQAWDWEKRRMERAAEASGRTVRFTPSLVLVDNAARRVVVLVWELDHDDCPFLVGSLCGAYAERPLVCRAFPLLLRQGALAASARCDSRVEPPEGTPDAVRAAYGAAYDAAERALATPRRVGAVVSFMEDAHAWQPARGLRRDLLRGRVEAWPRVGFVEAVVASGAMAEGELLERVAAAD